MAASWREHRYSISRVLLSSDRIPHFPVGLSSPYPGRTNRVCRFGLADLFVATACKLSVPLQSDLRHRPGTIADPVAPREGSERSTMEVPGRRNCGTYMKT